VRLPPTTSKEAESRLNDLTDGDKKRGESLFSFYPRGTPMRKKRTGGEKTDAGCSARPNDVSSSSSV
jgi:hypothetical protein